MSIIVDDMNALDFYGVKMADVFKEFGKAFIPEVMFGHPVRANLRSYLNTAGFKTVPYHFFGILFL